MLRARRFRAEPFRCLQGQLFFPLAADVSLLQLAVFMELESKGLVLASTISVAFAEDSQQPNLTMLAGGWHPDALASQRQQRASEGASRQEGLLPARFPSLSFLWFQQDRPRWLKILAKRRKSINK